MVRTQEWSEVLKRLHGSEFIRLKVNFTIIKQNRNVYSSIFLNAQFGKFFVSCDFIV